MACMMREAERRWSSTSMMRPLSPRSARVIAAESGSPIACVVDARISISSFKTFSRARFLTRVTSAMSSTGGDLYELGQATESALPAITSAHEFGHALLGASDEYANPAVPARVLTSDHSIMANFYSEGVAQAQFKPRHFQHILDEVGKAFPGHTCKLKQV